MNKEMDGIPWGIYCYTGKSTCPYWSIKPDYEEQNNGHCAYLDKGDWQVSLGLLWDMCKDGDCPRYGCELEKIGGIKRK